jgi:hypothetical protein
MSITTRPVQSRLSVVQRWPTETARLWASHVLAEICAHPRVLAVVLLGSTIRQTDSSFDFDCLYIYAGERPQFPAAPVEVDLRGFKAEDVERLIEHGNDLLVWSIRFGISICERNNCWSSLQRRWSEKLPFPSAEIAETRAAVAERLLNDLRESGDVDAALEQLVALLTHRARAALLRAEVFPASRPELPGQLREINEYALAEALAAAIAERNAMAHRSY